MKKYITHRFSSIMIGMKTQALYVFDTTVVSVPLTLISFWVLKVLGYLGLVLTLDHEVLSALPLLLLIDVFVGMRKWRVLRKFNTKLMYQGLMEKLVFCLIIMVVINIFVLNLAGHADMADYMRLLGMFIVLSYPAISIFKNIFFLTNGRFPPIGFMAIWENFEKTASVDDIFRHESTKADESIFVNETKEKTE